MEGVGAQTSLSALSAERERFYSHAADERRPAETGYARKRPIDFLTL
jgi:hypothetical protein